MKKIEFDRRNRERLTNSLRIAAEISGDTSNQKARDLG
jgi:hypothetical protein